MPRLKNPIYMAFQVLTISTYTGSSLSLSLSLSMAVSLQAPGFIPGASKTLPYPRLNPHFPSTHVGLLLRHPFNFNPLPSFLRKTNSLASPIRAAHNCDQVGGDGNQARGVSDSPAALIWKKNLLGFASNNFLPLALVGGVMFGLANPSLGCLADRYYLSKFSTVGIFIISGLTLRSDEIGAAAEAWPVGIFGLGSILLFTPFFSRLILQLQLQPQEFVTGLALFCCMPTTLSSGVALTRLAGGNSALALAMTLISSLLGILIVPFSISMFIANGVGVSVPTKQLFRSLILTLLVPLLIGKGFRETFKGLAVIVDQNRKLLSMISALLLGLVPWIQVSRSRSLLLMVKPTVFLVAVGMGALLHLILLAFNALSIQGLSAISGGSKSVFAKRENASALLIVANQLTRDCFELYILRLKNSALIFPAFFVGNFDVEMHIVACSIFLENSACNGSSRGAARRCIRCIWFAGSSLCCCSSEPDHNGLVSRKLLASKGAVC